MTVGTRAEVWHGTKDKTSGGLKKSDLLQNKWGRIVSAKKHREGKRNNRLLKFGFTARKGKFGMVRLGSAMSTRGRKKRRG